jgi:superoxide dismutase, Fe-Mn family
MPFSLPKLNYSFDALEPFIDKMTMEIHYSKHHQAYIDNLNAALLDQPEFKNMEVETLLQNIMKLPAEKQQAVINNGGGHANHTFFWELLTPNGKSKYELKNDEFKSVFESTFSDLDNFKTKFTEKAMSLFGSGWVFLVKTPDDKLLLKRHSFQNSPLMQGNIPILGIDLWEHAYYLKYQNRKKDYIEAFWNLVDWNKVEANYTKNK